MGDGASFGMIQAVAEHNESAGDTGQKAWFIDVIGDKRADYGDHLLTSVLFDYTATYNQMIDDLAAGTFGAVYTLDVKNGGVRLLDLPESVPQGIRDEVATQQEAIVSGQITVSAIGDVGGMNDRLDELFPR
jgi:basic membrane lipoprotein Med (substrate-binding protein (PBP1-ABC) superfamily)